MEDNEDIVEETTENMDEQTIEENVEGNEIATESGENTEEEKIYSKSDLDKILNERLNEIIPKKINRAKAKINKEYEKYSKIEDVLNAGLGTKNIEEATEKLLEFYENKGIKVPTSPKYSEKDIRVLANVEAEDIINSGYDEIVEEFGILAKKGIENMTTRERVIFEKLAETKKFVEDKKALAKIGVKDDVIESKDFKEFTKQFNPNTPIEKVYNLYSKANDTKQVEKIGSMKNNNSKEEKNYYSPEEVDKLTSKDLDDPKIFERVRESMAKWK